MKVIIVGRHKPADMGENIKVISQKDITFPHTSEMCECSLDFLVNEADSRQAALVFQAIPGQMAVAIARSRNITSNHIRVGVIVSVPGERPAAINKTFHFDDPTSFKEAWSVATFVNPNAIISNQGDWSTNMEVTVEPPMKFEFSHIEWF